MKIRGGQIELFGQFSKIDLPRFPNGLIVIYGENEAGKTTFLEFLRQMLFGFASAAQTGYYELSESGKPSGLLSLEDDAGTIYTLRREGARGEARVFNAADEITGGRKIHDLTSGLTRAAFENLYAFTIDELRSLGGAEKKELDELLYGATLGVSPQALKNATESLSEERRETFFKPRGRNQRINQALSEWRDVQTQLRTAQEGLDLYAKKKQSLADLASRIEQAQLDRGKLAKEIRWLENLIAGWESWVKYRHAVDYLKGRPAPPDLPFEEMKERLSQIEGEWRTMTKQLSSTEDAMKNTRSKIADVHIDEALLDHSTALEEKLSDLNVYKTYQQDIGPLEREIKDCEKKQETDLRDLGAEWTLERVEKANLNLFTREKIERFEDELTSLQRTLEKNQDTVARARDGYTTHQSKIKSTEEKINALSEKAGRIPNDSIEEVAAATQRAEQTLNGLEDGRQECERLSAELDRELKSIAPEWNEARLESFDFSLSAQRKAGEAARDLIKAEEALRDVEREAHRRQEKVEELERADSLAKARLSDIQKPPFDSLERWDERREKLWKLRSAFETIRQHQQFEQMLSSGSESDGKRFPSWPKWVLLIHGVISIFGGVGLFVALDSIVLLAILLSIGVLCLIGFLILLLIGSRTSSTRQAPAVDLIDKARSELNGLCSELGIEETLTPEVLDRLDSDMKTFRSMLTVYLDAIDEIERLEQSRSEAEDASQKSDEICRNAKAKAETARQHWANVLRECGLPVDLPASDVAPFYARIDAVRTRLDALKTARRRRDKDDQEWKDYLGRLSAVGFEDEVKNLPSRDLMKLIDKELVISRDAAKKHDERKRLESELKGLVEELTSLLQERDEAVSVYEESARFDEQKKQEWRGWLATNGLNEEYSPATARKALDLLGDIRRLIDSVATKRKELGEKQTWTRGFEESVKSIVKQVGADLSSDSVVAVLLDLKERLATNRDLAIQRTQLLQERDGFEAELQAIDRAQGALAEEKQEILKKAGCTSSEDFLRVSKESDLYVESMGIRDEQMLYLKKVLWTEDFSEIEAAYHGADPSVVQMDLEELRENQQEVESILEESIRQQADLDREVRDLETDELVGQLREREEELRARLDSDSRQWARLTLAGWLIEQARIRFERDRQPPLFKHASRLFKSITAGAYDRVYPLLDDPDRKLNASGPEGNKSMDRLSRGTREQLYLCLRFGYLLQRAEQAESMPLILDDVMVNFDEDRSRETARVFTELASESQVFCFTCHRRLLEILSHEVENVYAVELTPDGFQAINP